MVHPATHRAVTLAVAALGVPLDLGFVFPPHTESGRGYGRWTGRDLTRAQIIAMLQRAAAANAQGANIYMRLGPSVTGGHPGIVMLDDLVADAVDRLSSDGLEPCLVVETSPGNHQAWIRLSANGPIAYSTMKLVTRHLAETYGADRRAVSPRQPGRLPGFTNRKPKHLRDDGRYPFVRLIAGEPGRTSSVGVDLLRRLSFADTAAGALRAAPETPLSAASVITEMDRDCVKQLDAIYVSQKTRIEAEEKAGRRSHFAASLSEIDFAAVVSALEYKIGIPDISAWLSAKRPEKGNDYAERTIVAATRHFRNSASDPSNDASRAQFRRR